MNTFFRSILPVVLLIATCGCVAEPTQTQLPPDASSPATQPAPQSLRYVERIAADGSVTVAKLSNGLTVIVKPVRHNPVVCVRGYVRTGGLLEEKYLGTGISHLTEHLVAKGAVHEMGPEATAGEARQTSQRIKEIGGQSNAYTSLTHTCYHIAAAAGKTNDCIDLIADWLARPEITREDFEREHGVVQRELEMGTDSPEREGWYAHAENFFRSHPASVPVIGHKEPLSKLTHEDVLEYHRTTYVPGNMIFCVVGDVDVEQVLERTAQAFNDFAPGRAVSVVLPEVPRVAAVRRVVHPHKNLTEVMERMSFRTIPLIHDDLYALDVLAYALTEGKASRLQQRIMREEKLVTSIASGSWTPSWGAGMFTVSYRCEPDNADAAETAIIEELKKIVDEGIADDELTRSKRQKVADYVYSQQKVGPIAGALGTDYLSTGDVNFSQNYTQRIQRVTTEDVLRVARKYFNFEKLVITRLEPGSLAEAAAEEKRTTSQPTGASLLKLPNGLR
ncbi:MAG: M16 family metallopeptidase, partial [Planctomycetota bacterium]